MSNETRQSRYFDSWKDSKPREWAKANSYEDEYEESMKRLEDILRNNGKTFDFDKKDGKQAVLYSLFKADFIRLMMWIPQNKIEKKIPFSLARSWLKQLFEVLQYLYAKNVIVPEDDLYDNIFFSYENDAPVLKLLIPLPKIDLPLLPKTDGSQVVVCSVYPTAAHLLTCSLTESEDQTDLKNNFLDSISRASCFKEILDNDFLKDIDDTTHKGLIAPEKFSFPVPEERTFIENFMQAIVRNLSNEANVNLRKFDEVNSKIHEYFVRTIYSDDVEDSTFNVLKKTDDSRYHMSRRPYEEIFFDQVSSLAHFYEGFRHPNLISFESFVEILPNEWLIIYNKIIKEMVCMKTLRKKVDRIFPINEQTPQCDEKLSHQTLHKKDRGMFGKNFYVEEQIGTGHFSEVYKARNKVDAKFYAIKRRTVKNTLVVHEQREARTLADLEHVGIVRYFNTWNQSQANRDYMCIVMQLCHKETLFDWLKKNKTKESRPLDTMKNWIKQLAEALSYLHEELVIHRDVKPSHIFFALDNNEQLFSTYQTLKIGGFGSAKKIFIGNNESGRGSITNNPEYSDYKAPEQVFRVDYDEKVDVFALGYVATELIIPLENNLELSTFLSRLRIGNLDSLSETPDAGEFLLALTSMKPADRLSAKQVAAHPFLRSQEGTRNASHNESEFEKLPILLSSVDLADRQTQ